MKNRIFISMMALLLLFAMAATASAVSVNRDLPDDPVAAGAEFEVSISQTGFFVVGTVTDVLPPGYVYVDGSVTDVDDAVYTPATRTLVLTIDSENSTVTYRVTAGTADGTFVGTYATIDTNANPVIGDVTGEFAVTVVVPDNHPTASFAYTPENPTINQAITFDASNSTDPDGNIVSYAWDFGDGNMTTTTERIITHSYTSEGDYNVSLTVTGDEGATHSVSKVITITTLRGDVNHDGNITPTDAVIALRIAAGSREYDPAADINDDGVVTSLDALMILQAAADNIKI
jgi:PKD repeat protein